jgi:hypothetical protein
VLYLVTFDIHGAPQPPGNLYSNIYRGIERRFGGKRRDIGTELVAGGGRGDGSDGRLDIVFNDAGVGFSARVEHHRGHLGPASSACMPRDFRRSLPLAATDSCMISALSNRSGQAGTTTRGIEPLCVIRVKSLLRSNKGKRS